MDARVGEPMYFGRQDDLLFGCLHVAAHGPARQAAVILPPAGHEYASAHRAIRQLALRLAECGCTTLRLDLYGCGDSAGAKDSGTLARWRDDAGLALELLRERAPGAATHLIGVRLGASVAAGVGAALGTLDSLVLWDPVTSGADYLAWGLDLQRRQHGLRQRRDDPGPFEILGHAVDPALAEELRGLDLCALTGRPAPRVLVLDTRATSRDALVQRLRALRATVVVRNIDAPDLWSGDGHVALVPAAVNHAISEWVQAA